ncbi:SUIS protein, partial [Menura novaehollandiae]|nr:SUIS protein [Menura novaehollandiae]
QSLCEHRGCCWSPQSDPGVPWCSFSFQHGYRLDGARRDTEQGFEASLRRLQTPSLFGSDVGTVQLQAQFQTPARLRLQFTDPKKQRFKVPHEHVGPFSGTAATNTKYGVKI